MNSRDQYVSGADVEINPVIRKQLEKQFREMNLRREATAEAKEKSQKEKIRQTRRNTANNAEFIKCNRCKDLFGRGDMVRRYFGDNQKLVNVCEACNKILGPVRKRK